MRSVWKGLLAVSFLVGAAQGVYAKCDVTGTDAAAVAAARQDAKTMCPCASAANHGAYVKCVKGVANTLSSGQSPTLPKDCKGAVVKCAAHSVCGKPGFVTCCITKNAVTKCKTKSSADSCTKAGGVMTGCSSCCDACPAPGSGPSCSPSGAFLE
jgi:hypothetical protein